MGKAGTNFRRVLGGAAVLSVISVTLLSIFAIASGIAAPTNKKQAAERTRSHVPSALDEASAVCTLSEGFDNIGTLIGNGWFMQNNSMPVGITGWSQGNPAIFPSQSGAADSYVDADFNNGSGSATISNWLLTPELTLQNNGVLTFWTRTADTSPLLLPDRLQVRMSANGASSDVGSTATSVGDFTTLLLDINPTYVDNYPHVWTQYTVTISGLQVPTTGRIAFRYFVENGGILGTRSNYIGLDAVAYACPPTPDPTPTLGGYPNTSIALSSDTVITPDMGPTNVTRMNVSTSTNFNGELEGDPTTGVVRVTDAHPAGTYVVTVKAFGPGGTLTRTFNLTVTTPLTCTPVTFGAATSLSIDGAARGESVAVGDFNRDGFQDVAVAGGRSCCGGGVAIFLGNGAGNFSFVGLAPGGFDTSVAVGDFNSDGKQDLTVTNQGATAVSILLGDGSGNFSAAVNFGPVFFGDSVAVGDFNGDGKQDLAVVSNAVDIFLGDGGGGFGTATRFGAGNNPNYIAVGDFNSDGKQDLAVSSSETPGNVAILLGNGAGGFSGPVNFPVGDNPSSIAVGDFNGDGKQDLATANSTSNNVSILLGNGASSFSGPTNFPAGTSTRSLAVGDFDGNGTQDIATGNNSSNNISILLGDGAGNFSAPNDFPVGADIVSIAVGDFNGDGKQDLATANYLAGSMSIVLRNCALTPTIAVSRKTHEGAGDFDISLPLTGNPGIECRTSGRATSDYTLVVTFPGPVSVDGDPQAQVTLGTGTVPNGTVTINGNTVAIPVTGVTNSQTINVTLFRANGGGNVVIPMAVLGGDTNGDRAVNSGDIGQTKSQSGAAVTASNFREDVNADGSINSGDVSLVKSLSGTGLP